MERATCRQARIGEHFMCLMSLTASIYINLYINVALLRLVEHRVVTRSSMSMNKKAQQQCFNIMPACCCCWSGCCCCRKGIHATLFTFLSSSLPFPSRSFFVELRMNPTNEPTMSWAVESNNHGRTLKGFIYFVRSLAALDSDSSLLHTTTSLAWNYGVRIHCKPVNQNYINADNLMWVL